MESVKKKNTVKNETGTSQAGNRKKKTVFQSFSLYVKKCTATIDFKTVTVMITMHFLMSVFPNKNDAI